MLLAINNPPRGADLVKAVDIAIIVILAIIAAIIIYFLRPLMIAIVIILLDTLYLGGI